jgi:Fe-S-cluster containining protein
VRETSKKDIWYSAGLHFECMQCGRCCSGPAGGYIWATKPEIKLIADFLRLSVEQLRQKYLKRVGLRTTVVEQAGSKDCMFLQRVNEEKRCVIYPVRPSQCRTWPFWPDNLAGPAAWNQAAQKCPGINHGKLYSLEEIQEIKKAKQWWKDSRQTVGY